MPFLLQDIPVLYKGVVNTTLEISTRAQTFPELDVFPRRLRGKLGTALLSIVEFMILGMNCFGSQVEPKL
jgi:hypothetical protein